MIIFAHTIGRGRDGIKIKSTVALRGKCEREKQHVTAANSRGSYANWVARVKGEDLDNSEIIERDRT